jgi:hypothetical protein
LFSLSWLIIGAILALCSETVYNFVPGLIEPMGFPLRCRIEKRAAGNGKRATGKAIAQLMT